MKLTRRSLFATIGLLFTDPRKLLAKPSVPMGRPCLTINRFPEFIIRNSAGTGWLFNPKRNIAADWLKYLAALDLQRAREREQDVAFLRGDRW